MVELKKNSLLAAIDDMKVPYIIINDKALFDPYILGNYLGIAKSTIRGRMRFLNKEYKVKLTPREANAATDRVYFTEIGAYLLISQTTGKQAIDFRTKLFEIAINKEVIKNGK